MPTKVKFDPKNKELLISNDRRNALDLFKLLSLFPIVSHHIIADVGCGSGLFTVPMAKMVFDGRVYALDVQQEMLDAVRESVQEVNLSNVEVMKSQERKLPLEDESLDGVLAAFVLQEASSPRTLLKEAMRCLRKSGWLVVMEWDKREMDEGPPESQRIDIDEMQTMMEKVGFRFRERRDLNGKQYMILARK